MKTLLLILISFSCYAGTDTTSDAIQSYIQELINPHLSESLAKDPDVLKIKQELLAKEQELAAEIKRKIDEVNGARG